MRTSVGVAAPLQEPLEGSYSSASEMLKVPSPFTARTLPFGKRVPVPFRALAMLPVISEVGGVSANDGVALRAQQMQAARRASRSSGSCFKAEPLCHLLPLITNYLSLPFKN